MAQNLTALFGAAGATRFRQLLASAYRAPVWRVKVFTANGATLLGDITPFLKSFSTRFTDETKADAATFVFDNTGARFDRYGAGGTTQYLLENNVLQMEKGLRDPLNGVEYFLPAFYGSIIFAQPSYAPRGEMTISVACADALKLPIKQKITSFPYENTEVNRIASDLLRAFGKFAPGRIKLANVQRVYGFVQFPDVTLVDALKTLFDPLLFFVRADEAGNITTAPRLGSSLSRLAGVLGFPDQIAAPLGSAVDYVFPDVPGVESIEPGWQDFDGVYNQFRVQGKATAAAQTLGPNMALFRQGNSSIAADGKIKEKYDFTQNGNSGQNAVVAKNVYVVFNYSTNHNLDTEPRTEILSLMKWRAAWSALSTYKEGDAVSHGGSSWACAKFADGTREPGTAPGKDYWDAIPVSGPFTKFFEMENEDPRRVGFVSLESVTSANLVMKIEGREYSVGQFPTRHHGGFDYEFTIHGQPVLSHQKTLTAYADYNAQNVTGEIVSDIFGDHLTYQAAHQPFAMSVPVEVFRGGVSLGKIAANQTDLSGETAFSVDFERGRIVLKDLSYQNFSADNGASHPLSTGGSAQSTGQVFDLSLLDSPAPQGLYQTRRDGDSTYTLGGLIIGQGYDIRLHFADPTYGSEGERVFSIYAQGDKVIEGLDIAQKVGGLRIAYQETLTGIAPDVNGVIRLNICQKDPVSGIRLDEAEGPSAIISGIEVLFPQGQGAAPYAINCGGPAINPTPPVITAIYGYSPIQETYQIQSEEMNNPLISTQAEAESVARFHVNRAAWRRHPHRIRAASVPHVQPGDLVRYYNPQTNADYWCYVREIRREMQAGSGNSGGADTDSLETYLIYKQTRLSV